MVIAPMSKIYDALKHAERERSAEQGEAVARVLARATEERAALRAEIAACREQLTALATRVDAAPPIAPATIDDLTQRVAQLAAQQERLAVEPQQLIEGALQRFEQELSRQNAALQSRLEERAGASLRLDEDHLGGAPALDALRRELDAELAAMRAAQQDSVQHTQRLFADASAMATHVGQRVDELLALNSKLEALGAQQQRTHERIERAAKDLAAAVQDLYSRTDDLGHESEQARDSIQADVASVRQQLGEALHDRDDRLAQLAQGVRTAQSEQQLVLAELRQQMAAMELLSTSSRSELRELVESAAERTGEALRRLESVNSGLQNHDALLGRIQTAQAELKALVQRSEKRGRELAGETSRSVDEQAQRSEALGAALESLRTRLADAEAAGRGAAQRWQEELDHLLAAVAESNAALAATNSGRLEEVRTRLDAVHERLAGADDAQQALQLRWAEQLAEQHHALSSQSAETLRVTEAYRSESQAGQRDLRAQLDAVGAAQAEIDRRLRVGLDTVETSLAAQQESVAGAIDTLRVQVASLVESQPQLQEFADGVARAQATADEALSRVAAVDGLRAASLAALRQQMAALHADRVSLRDAVQASLAAQQQASGDIDALRAQVAPLVESPAQLQELADGVRRAQASADDAARRVAAIDGALAASLAALRQQITALQADGAGLRDAVEAVQASLAAQQEAAGEIDALRAQVAPLADAQVRLQEVAEGIGRAQATADEAARRIAAIDGALAAVYRST